MALWVLRRSRVPGEDGGSAVERSQGLLFVGVDVEEGGELGDLHEVVDSAGEVEEFEGAGAGAGGGVGGGEFADAGAIHVVHVAEVEDEFPGAGVEGILDGVAEGNGAFAEGDAAADFEEGGAVGVADRDFCAHGGDSCGVSEGLGSGLRAWGRASPEGGGALAGVGRAAGLGGGLADGLRGGLERKLNVGAGGEGRRGWRY